MWSWPPQSLSALRVGRLLHGAPRYVIRERQPATPRLAIASMLLHEVGPTLNAYTLFAHPLRGQFDSGQRADTEFSRVKQGAGAFVSAITEIDFFSSVAVRSGLRGKKLSTVEEHRAALNLLKMCVFAADVVDVHDPLPYGSHEFPRAS